MTAFLVPLVLIGGLTSVGVYLLLERNLTRMLLGLLLIGNAVNLLILLVGGPSGNPPVRGRVSDGQTATADPLAQAMILTAIVISMGIAAFVLSLIYRTYRLTTEEEVANDPEDTRVSQLTDEEVDGRRREPSDPGHGPRHRRARRVGRAAGAGGVAMSTSSVLTPLPVLIPMIGAATTMFAGRRPRLQRAITLGALSAVVVVCAALLYLTDRDGTLALHVGGWGQSVAGMGPLGITLVVDRLSALMMVVSSIVLLAVVLYAIGQGIRDGDERQPVSIFLPTYLVLSAGVCNAFLAGDLFNLFVGFEVLLAASFVLLTIGASTERVRVGISYVMVSMVSSMIFLIGIALVYAATGTLNMAEVATRLDGVSPGTRSALFAVLLVAFGIKAAVFPLSTWLPDSYPTAPAPVTAVFAGLLTKVGVYAIIRAHTLLFPSGGLDRMLMVAAFLTMLVGILGAIAQSDIKRLLSFTLVSHIGYMVFGVALSSELGLSGAIYYVAHHILVQTTLFLVVGLIERQAGASTLQRLGGLAAASPVLAFVFVIPALNLGGIPPFSGFIGKVALLEAGAQNGSVLAWTLVGGSVVTSLLTLYVVSRVWTLAFWRARADAPEGDIVAATPSALLDDTEDIALAERDDVGRMPVGMLVPTGALIVVGLTLTVLAGPIVAYSDRAAAEVLDRDRYISAVLSGVTP